MVPLLCEFLKQIMRSELSYFPAEQRPEALRYVVGDNAAFPSQHCQGVDPNEDVTQFRLLKTARSDFDVGVCLHAHAADLAAVDGERGLLASDLFGPLRRLVNAARR